MELADSSYTYSISDTMLDNKPCHLVGYRKTDWEPDKTLGMQTIRYEVQLWIEKQSLLPIQSTTLSLLPLPRKLLDKCCTNLLVGFHRIEPAGIFTQ